ncbi:hypothetical protein I4U23_015120 [Adineta vaga]|nr:hypothetical protein I4U23_015120 [Adineta vaga]
MDLLHDQWVGEGVTLDISLSSNSIIWTFYWKIQNQLERFISLKYDQIIIPLSSTLAALLISLITQQIDVLKTTLQLSSKRQSLWNTFPILIHERGLKGICFGSLRRTCIVIPNSVLIISLYEIIKRASIQN